MPGPEDRLAACPIAGEEGTIVDLRDAGHLLGVLARAYGDERVAGILRRILARHDVEVPLTAYLYNIKRTDRTVGVLHIVGIIERLGRGGLEWLTISPDKLRRDIIIVIEVMETMILLLHKVRPSRRTDIGFDPSLLSLQATDDIGVPLGGHLPLVVEGVSGGIDAGERDKDTEVVQLKDVAIGLRAYCDADELGAEVFAGLFAVVKLPLEEGICRVEGPVGVAPAQLLGGVDVIAHLEGVLISGILRTEVGGEVVDVLRGADIILKRLLIYRELAVVRISSDDLLHRDHV